MTADSRSAGWRPTNTFLVRRAGFPFGLLADLGSARPGAVGARLADAADRTEACRDRMLRELFPAEVAAARDRGDRAALRALSKLRSRVGARRPGPVPAALAGGELAGAYAEWAGLCEQAEQLTDELADAAAEERRRVAAALRAAADRPDVADAILQLSPSFHEAATGYRRALPDRDGAAERAHDRRLYAFLQRLAAKNETTSFFGPVTFGRFGGAEEAGGVEGVGFGPEEPAGVRSRRAFVSFWAAVEIGRAGSRAEPVRDRMPLRRLPVLRVVDGAVVLPGRPPRALTGPERRVLDACDGVRTAGEIAAATGLARDEVSTAVRALERAALVQRRCEPSSTTFDPLGGVLRQLPPVPALAGFRAGVGRFAAEVEAFAAAPGPERPAALARAERSFTELTGRPARRAAGATYADRSVLFEDCEGDAAVVLSPGWRHRLGEQLAPVLDFGLAVGQAVRRSYRQLAAGLLAEQGPLPYLDFVERIGAADRAGWRGAGQEEVRRLHAAYGDLVAARSDGRIARLDPAELAALARPVPGAAFVSPDVLPSTDGTLVLGEIHPYVFGWGLQGGFAPDAEGLRRELDALLPVWGGADRLATVLHRRRHKGLVSERFPGTFVEVTGSAGTGPRRAAVADLRVELIDGEPELLGPDGALQLYVGEDDHAHLRVFAPAQVDLPRVRLGESTPRVVVGRVVAQRASWLPSEQRLAALAGAAGADLVLAAAVLRRDLALPRHLFAASPTETKPVHLDLDCLPALEHLGRLAGLGPVRLVEMLPAPEQLWLRRSTGPHTCELRLSMLRGQAG